MSAAAALPLIPNANAATQPNVIIVLADDQGYGDMSCHGNKVLKTPAMDKLHGESVRFTDFHAAPMCTPMRSQLMTGRNCLSNRAMNVSSGRTLLRRDFPTMAEVFRDSGYRTGIFGKWHLGDNYPYRPHDRGFEEAVWFPSSHVGSAPDAWNNDYFNDRYRHNEKLEQYSGYCTDVFFGEAKKWIRQRAAAGERFFAYIPLNAPHGPLFVEPKYAEPYKQMPPNVARFYGMLANLDQNLGALDAMLGELKLRENTVLIYMSDNGGTAGVSQYNAGLRGNKTTLYDGGHRAPCFARWPGGGIGGGREIADLTQAQDLLPTFIELCGLKKPKNASFDGASLVPLLKGAAKELPERTLIVQFSRMNAPMPQKNDATLMRRKWRLVQSKELYDVAADPAQAKNVIDSHPDIVKRMQADYDKWWKTVEPHLGSFLPVHIGSDQENPTALSPCEWADSFLDQGGQIRRAEKRNGIWHLHAERAGNYEITLRRWQRGIDLTMTEATPPHKGEVGEYAAGVALPVAEARMNLGTQDSKKAVSATDRETVFRVKLPKGPTTLQTWFLDKDGNELCGAYYVYVEFKP
ncbi:MAG: arylsulfatase [Acidobacteria bacterium]|nr:arylsulfatase [Acidobacteriota bacterium]